jgi:hypothetical protein
MTVFNRTYQVRSRRGSMISVPDMIEELNERAEERQSFRRTAERVPPGKKMTKSSAKNRALQGVQLELFPLFDLIPEASQ